MKIRIKTSKRGLTFSFKENESFKVGSRYRYIVDTTNNEIRLLPDNAGRYKLSRKGINEKPLVDLRNKEIRGVISSAKYLEIEIQDNIIAIHIIKLETNIEQLSDRKVIELLDKSEKTTIYTTKENLQENGKLLLEALQASGLFSTKIANDISYVFDVVSLFSGAGMLDYPFYKDDCFNIKFACDFDKSACETYKINIGNHIICEDMRDLMVENIPNMDLIIGGPCCQGYSNENRHNINKDTSKIKRLLIDDYIRVVKAKKPKVFLIENVPQFLTKENGKYLERVLIELSDYEITYQVVTDYKVGGYTKRKRMILIGSKIGKINIPDVELSRIKTTKEALIKVNDDWYNYKDITKTSPETQRKMAFVKPGGNYKDIPEMAHLNRHSNTYKRLHPDEPAITITNWRKVNLMPPTGNRILSVAEASALMGFDKEFKFLGTINDKQQQCGNGVTRAIATFIKSIIKNAFLCYTNNLIF